jgi:hypothetical protein
MNGNPLVALPLRMLTRPIDRCVHAIWMLSSCCQGSIPDFICPDRRAYSLIALLEPDSSSCRAFEREKVRTISSEIFAQTASSDFLSSQEIFSLWGELRSFIRMPALRQRTGSPETPCRRRFPRRSHGDFKQATRVTIECLVAQFDGKQLVCDRRRSGRGLIFQGMDGCLIW